MSHQSATDNEAYLSLVPFQEVVGRLDGIRRTKESTFVDLSTGTLRFPASSAEAAICDQELANHEGARVSLLRTPSPNDPIRIRIIMDDT